MVHKIPSSRQNNIAVFGFATASRTIFEQQITDRKVQFLVDVPGFIAFDLEQIRTFPQPVAAAFQVLAAAGTLTAKDLGLKVKLYDPLQHYDDDADRWIGFGD